MMPENATRFLDKAQKLTATIDSVKFQSLHAWYSSYHVSFKINFLGIVKHIYITLIHTHDRHSLSGQLTSRYIDGGLCSPPNLSKRASRCSWVNLIICLMFHICKENYRVSKSVFPASFSRWFLSLYSMIYTQSEH